MAEILRMVNTTSEYWYIIESLGKILNHQKTKYYYYNFNGRTTLYNSAIYWNPSNSYIYCTFLFDESTSISESDSNGTTSTTAYGSYNIQDESTRAYTGTVNRTSSSGIIYTKRFFALSPTSVVGLTSILPIFDDADEYWDYITSPQEPIEFYSANGGGATHIAKVTGQLKDLSSNLSDILLVSGGGGGGLLVGETATQGQNAGGISGSGTNSGNQSTGYAFGQGESGVNVSGGGAGLYGGSKGTSSISGGAGSGYIGNSLLSNKKMVGYNVPTSSDASTKTESVSVYSASGEADKPKAGNGKAKIKFLRDAEWITAFDGEATTYVNGNFSVDGSQYTSSNTHYAQSGNKYRFNSLYYYENQYAGVRSGYIELGGSLIPSGVTKLRIILEIEAQIGIYGNGYWKFGFNGVTCSDQFKDGAYDNGQGAIKPTEGNVIKETRAYILEGDSGGKQLKFEGPWYNWISRASAQIWKIEYYKEG